MTLLEVPSITREHLSTRGLVGQKVDSRSLFICLEDYMNNFTLIDVVAQYLGSDQDEEDICKVYEHFLPQLQERKERLGYLVPRFDLQTLLSEEELHELPPTMLLFIVNMNVRADIINLYDVSDKEMPLICEQWDEMQKLKRQLKTFVESLK